MRHPAFQTITRLSRAAAIATLAGCAATLAIGCYAQEGQGDSGDPAREERSEKELAAPAGPDTVIWIDDNGVPRPVLGVTYEEFARAWRAYQGLDNNSDQAQFTINSLTASGRQYRNHIKLRVRFRIDLHVDQTVRAPLGFGTAILAEEEIEGLEDQDRFEYSKQGECYLAQLTGGGQRTLQFTALLPITAAGQRKEITLTSPRANHSEVLIQMDGSAVEPTVSDGALLDVVENATGSRLSIRGGVGRLRLAWRSPSLKSNAPRSVVLTSVGEIATTLDASSARSAARLTVRSFGGPFDTFHVRLPEGATLLPPTTGTPGFQVGASSQDGLCVVTLPEPTVGPVTVSLQTEQAIGLGGSTTVDLAGFEVEGAVRQHGNIALSVDANSQLRWGDLAGAHRVALDDLPGALQQPGVTAAARYYRQENCHIPVAVLPSETHIYARPEYELKILPDEAILDVTTRYQVIGAPVLEFRFDLGDWTELTPKPIEFVGQIDAIDANNVVQTFDGSLDIPLLKPQSGAVSVKFQARRSLSPGDGRVEFRLPRPLAPKADKLGKPLLTMLVDPGLQVKFDQQASTRLRPTLAPPQAPMANGAPRFGRFFFEGDAPIFGDDWLYFAVQKTIKPGRMSAHIESSAVVGEEQTEIRQRFDFDLRQQPAERIELLAPPEVLVGQGPRLTLVTPAPQSGEALERATPLSWVLDTEAGTILIDLPQPWLGPLVLNAEYELQQSVNELAFGAGMSLSLLTPPDAQRFSHNLTVDTPVPAALAPSAERGSWRKSVRDSGPGGLALETTTPEPHLALVKATDPLDQMDGPVVRRTWRQTWVRTGEIQHRCAWRIAGAREALRIKLPNDTTPNQVEVLLDGRQTDIGFLGADVGEIKVALPAAEGAEERTIEIRYLQRTAEGAPAALDLQPPTLVADDRAANCYWQVILPKQLWVRSRPPMFQTAQGLLWGPNWFRNTPNMTTHELEDWAGAKHLGLTASSGERAWLYSSLVTPPGNWRLGAVNRNLLVLLASAAIAAIGMLVIYSPGVWRPLVGGVLAAGVAALAMLYPAQAALVGQAGATGLFALLLGWTTWFLLRPEPRVLVDVASDSTAIRQPISHADTSLTIDSGTVSSNAPTVSLEVTDPVN